MNDEMDVTPSAMDRRTFVRRAATTAGAGAMVWAAPSITTVSRAFGQTLGSPDCGRIIEEIGNLVEIDRPLQARKDQIVDDVQIRIWLESVSNSGPAGISVVAANPDGVSSNGGPGGNTLSIPPNTPFAMYMVHAQTNPATGTTDQPAQTGGVRFSAPILGVTSTWNGLGSTDSFSPVIYDQVGIDLVGRRFEPLSDENGDRAEVESNGVVNIVTKQGGYPDQMRIFVACAQPDDQG